jgi:hypothetical protein
MEQMRVAPNITTAAIVKLIEKPKWSMEYPITGAKMPLPSIALK